MLINEVMTRQSQLFFQEKFNILTMSHHQDLQWENSEPGDMVRFEYSFAIDSHVYHYHQTYESYFQVLSDVGGMYSLFLGTLFFLFNALYDNTMMVKIANSFYRFKTDEEDRGAKENSSSEEKSGLRQEMPDLKYQKNDKQLTAYLRELVVHSYKNT